MQMRTQIYQKLTDGGEERGGGFATAKTTASVLTVADQAPYSSDVVPRPFQQNKTSNFNFAPQSSKFKYWYFTPQKKIQINKVLECAFKLVSTATPTAAGANFSSSTEFRNSTAIHFHSETFSLKP